MIEGHMELELGERRVVVAPPHVQSYDQDDAAVIRRMAEDAIAMLFARPQPQREETP